MGIHIFNGKPIARPTRLTAKEKASKRIVVGDDERLVRMPIIASLRTNGYEIVHEAGSLEQLDEIVEKSEPDLVLLDLDWGKGPRQGLDAMKRFEEKRIPTNYIIVSGQDDEEIILEGLYSVAIDFIEKPVNPKYLNARVEKALIDIDFRVQATTDSMTQIANKGVFLKQLNYLIADFQRNKRNFSLAMMDIDNFKRYNDNYGHLE